MNIRAAIWDLGGVLLRTEDCRPRKQLAEWLNIPAEQLEDLVFHSVSGRQAQLGEISIEQHWENVRRELGVSSDVMPEIRRLFWGGDVLDETLVAEIRSLRGASYKTGLLSNAFSETRRFIVEKCRIADTFNQIVISAEDGMMKPDPRMYQIMLDRLGISPAEAVFIDDSRENIWGAQSAGLQTIQFVNPAQVRQDLQVLLDGGYHV